MPDENRVQGCAPVLAGWMRLREGRLRGMSAGSQAVALSAGEVVLGLVIERSGDGKQLQRRLEMRFGSAQFARGTAQQAVKRLHGQGLVRPVEDVAVEDASAWPRPCTGVEGEGLTVFEATPAGVAYFERWLLGSSGVPVLREELHAKIALCGPGNLPRMIELVREAEHACMVQLEECNARRRRERHLRDEDEWDRLMGVVVGTGEMVWWDARLKWLHALRQYLQREAPRYRPR